MTPLFPLEQGAVTTDDYFTPKWLFDQMDLVFDQDVASPPGGVPWIPAINYYSMADDGLSQTWFNRVWMNPPFSNAAPWIDRFIVHHHGVALVRNGANKWGDKLWASDASLVILPYNFQFVREGMRTDIRDSVMLVAFGDECVEAIGRIGRVR